MCTILSELPVDTSGFDGKINPKPCRFSLHNLFITTDHPMPQVIQTRSYTFFTLHLVGKTDKRQEELMTFAFFKNSSR